MSLKVLITIFAHFSLLIVCYQLCKIPFKGLAIQSAQLFNIYLNKALNEDDKLKQLWTANLKLIGWFLIFGFSIGIGIIVVFSPFQVLNIPVDFITDWKEWLAISVLFSVLVIVYNRRRIGDYNSWQILLHYLVLDNLQIGKWLFKRAGKKKQKDDQPYLLITGLARSGTTALLNHLMKTEQFNSTSYKDMPFVMSPGLMSGLTGKSKSKRQRAHGDDLLINEESVEAFEEVFFKTITDDSYVKEEELSIHELNSDLIIDYAVYRNLVKREKPYYLAKNNNAILRLNSLLDQDENLRVVLLFRDPIQHAISLFEQHQNFSFQQDDDPFVLTYMNWLGHYEFGLNHKQFGLHKTSQLNPKDINYWLEVWCNYYEYVLKEIVPNNQVKLIDFETVCALPNQVIQSVGEELSFEFQLVEIKTYEPKHKEANFEARLKDRAFTIHEKLSEYL